MGRSPAAGSSPRALVALLLVVVAGVAAGLFFALGPEPASDDGAAVPGPGRPGNGEDAGPSHGGGPARPSKPGPAPHVEGFGSIRGQVRLFRTKEPVAGFTLSLRQADGASVAATTDASGVFAFANVPAGPGWELRGARESFAPIELTGIDLAPDQALDVGVLWLAVPVDLPALVVDTTGAPVEGAEVAAFALGRTLPEEPDEWSEEAREQRTLSLVSSPRPNKTAKTDAKGRATVSGLMPGAYRAVASSPRFAAASRSGITLVPDAKPEVVRFVLGPAHSLEGTVFDEKDAPVVKARVIAARQQGGLPSLDKAFADTADDGTYRIDGLASGPHLLYLARPGRPLLQVGQVGIPETSRFDVRLRPGGTIRGTVTDEEGKPVAGAEIRTAIQTTWSPMAAKSDREGVFELKDVPAGALAYFRVQAEGFIPHPEPSAQQQGAGESLREGQTMTRDVVLRRGRTAEITVTGEEKGGVEGAEVRLHLATSWGSETKPWRAVTDTKGVARVTGLLASDYVVVVVAEGWVQTGLPTQWQGVLHEPLAIPAACRVSVAPDGDVRREVKMTRGLAVEGRVLDASGKTFAGAVVTIEGARSEFPVFSGGDGRFRVEAVPALRRSVAHAVAPDGSAGESEPFQVQAGAPPKDVEVRLQATARVSGTVRTQDGRAARGAVVRWFSGEFHGGGPESWPQIDSTERFPVAADGTFSIEGVTAGAVTVRADAEGLLPGFERITVAPGAEAGVTLVLTAPREIRGRVQAQSGGPVRGASVSAQFQGKADGSGAQFTPGLPGNPVAQSDAEGRFVLRGLAEGRYQVAASAPGYAGGAVAETSTESGEVLLVLAPGKSIAGFVRDPEGRPCAGVPVSAERTEQQQSDREFWGWWGGTMVYTGPDGSFEFQELAEGAYRLRVSSAWQWGREVNVEETVKEGVSAGDRDVEITVRAGLAIEGRLVDREKKPVRVGWVYSNFQDPNGEWNWENQRWVQVRPDGTFRLAGLKPGQYDVHAYGSFRQATQSGVAAGTKDVEITVEPAFTITGVLFDERGLGVPSADVMVRRAGSDDWDWTSTAFPGDGEFVVAGLEEGAYDVQFTVPGYAPTIVPRVAAGRTDVEVRLRAGLEVSGVVVDASGAPVKGAYVGIESRKLAEGSPNVSHGMQADDGGAFRFVGLLAGEYVVAARAEGKAPAFQRGVRAGTDGLKLVVAVGTTLTGTVVDRDGAPVQGLNVVVYTEDDVWLGGVTTSAEGKFQAMQLPAGERLKVVVNGQNARGDWFQHVHDPVLEPGTTEVKVELK
jgi:protocatechuate 3,4-dioxygenase beta subunit